MAISNRRVPSSWKSRCTLNCNQGFEDFFPPQKKKCGQPNLMIFYLLPTISCTKSTYKISTWCLIRRGSHGRWSFQTKGKYSVPTRGNLPVWAKGDPQIVFRHLTENSQKNNQHVLHLFKSRTEASQPSQEESVQHSTRCINTAEKHKTQERQSTAPPPLRRCVDAPRKRQEKIQD